MSIHLDRPNIVVPAVTLEHATRLLAETAPDAAPWDIAELRLDRIGTPPGLAELIARAGLPTLLTPRHPAEGGEGDALSPHDRGALLAPLLPAASALDLEIASAGEMAGTIERARGGGTLVVLSFHDFGGTPGLGELRDTVKMGIGLGADIVKLATLTTSAADVANLISLLGETEHPLSVMGMGHLGMASRLLAAQCGSILNYAAAGDANVEGQWPAGEFRSLLERTGCR